MADAQKGPSSLNYDEEKNKLKRFLAEFHTKNDRGQKEFVYARQLTNIAHREQVNLTLDLDHVAEFDPELADAIRNNTRRFITLASEAVWDLLPDYREHDPPARDALDVYINHRTLMEARTRNPGDNRPAQNAFPPELMRRFEVNFKVIISKNWNTYRKSSIRSRPCIILDSNFPRLVLELFQKLCIL